MAQTTITEALAELKTLQARIEKKRQFVMSNLGRNEAFRDPHEKEGGSRVVLERERQAIRDLEERIVAIRSAIQGANRENKITVLGESRTIHDWLVWRRDVAPGRKDFLSGMQRAILNARTEAQKRGVQVNPAGESKPNDIIISVNEAQLAEDIENMEEVLGTLDGQLSLKNATVTIAV